MNSLRNRLITFGGFTTADFVQRRGMYGVNLLQDRETATWYLVGATGSAMRSTLAFPTGYRIDFTAGAMNAPMQIVDQGTIEGEPYLELSLPALPDLETRLWPMGYYCANVDMTWLV